MTLSRLWTRLVRVEERTGPLLWYAEGLTWVIQRVDEAAVATALALDVRQALCAALRHAGQGLGRESLRHYRESDTAQQTIVDHLMSTMRTVVDAHITDRQTRARLYQEIQNAFDAARKREQGEP
jgi:hypothetical protein